MPSFGFLDNISNPQVKDFDKVIYPGPVPVEPGILITRQTGDPYCKEREGWSKDGSLLIFRYLFQKVPEFNSFLKKIALSKDGNGNIRKSVMSR